MDAGVRIAEDQMKYFSNWQAPLWRWIDKKSKYFDVPLNASLEVEAFNDYGDLAQVKYINAKGVSFLGWMDKKYLEPFEHALPFDCVDMSDIQTPEGSDAAQYVIWDGVKQTNECGPISVAYILSLPLSAILSNWKTKGPKLYKRIFGQGKATGTTAPDLIEIFALAGLQAVSIDLTFKKYSPYLLKEYLKDNDVILSCNLDTASGRLRGSGVGHWVVLVEVVCDAQGFGWVIVMNPFNNRQELYSWQEWLGTSRNYPYGVSVKKSV